MRRRAAPLLGNRGFRDVDEYAELDFGELPEDFQFAGPGPAIIDIMNKQEFFPT